MKIIDTVRSNIDNVIKLVIHLDDGLICEDELYYAELKTRKCQDQIYDLEEDVERCVEGIETEEEDE